MSSHGIELFEAAGYDLSAPDWTEVIDAGGSVDEDATRDSSMILGGDRVLEVVNTDGDGSTTGFAFTHRDFGADPEGFWGVRSTLLAETMADGEFIEIAHLTNIGISLNLFIVTWAQVATNQLKLQVFNFFDATANLDVNLDASLNTPLFIDLKWDQTNNVSQARVWDENGSLLVTSTERTLTGGREVIDAGAIILGNASQSTSIAAGTRQIDSVAANIRGDRFVEPLNTYTRRRMMV